MFGPIQQPCANLQARWSNLDRSDELEGFLLFGRHQVRIANTALEWLVRPGAQESGLGLLGYRRGRGLCQKWYERRSVDPCIYWRKSKHQTRGNKMIDVKLIPFLLLFAFRRRPPVIIGLLTFVLFKWGIQRRSICNPFAKKTFLGSCKRCR